MTSAIPKGLQELLQGVLQYAQEHGPWRIYQQENRKWMYELHDLKRWGCTGVIAADYHSAQEARQIADLGVPVIVLLQPHPMRRRGYPLFRWPCVVWNSDAIGQMAANYFLERHYTLFAFVGHIFSETYWSKERDKSFRRTLRQAGHRKCHVYAPCSEAEQHDWAVERPRMEAWLQALPKPIALFAPNDRRGKQVLDACIDAGVSVPDEVAVLCVDNDEWICEASVPTLSSIQCDPRPAGYRIAAHLDRLMRGERLNKIEYSVEPLRVVSRQSTEWVAIADKQMACALRFIRVNAANPRLRVADIAKSVGLSRRATEIRFRNATGRTVREEIEHVRLERLRSLLLENDGNISELAHKCGFACQTHLGRIFRARYGMTAGQFRTAPHESP
ncbi:MAG: XylR family transcriptional regulator [Kiritimatiellae bacterium]|nr:XylR family transcriptional regulator [Kiritimatiellia bacterium]